MLELFGNFINLADAALFNQDRNEITQHLRTARAADDGVHQSQLLLMGHRGVLQNVVQLQAGIHQLSDAVQFLHGLRGIDAAVHHNFSKGPSIPSGNGSHQRPSFPSCAANSCTNAWSAICRLWIFFSAKSTARSAANAFSSRRAAPAAIAISCSADCTMRR